MIKISSVAILLTLLLALPAHAAQCGGDFRSFLGAMAADARAAGISQRTIETAFAGVTPDPAVTVAKAK